MAEPCWYCNMLVSQDQEGRLFATNPAVVMPWACPANLSGHRVKLLASWEDTSETKAAYRAYDALARAMPQCEHVTAWLAATARARGGYPKAQRARRQP